MDQRASENATKEYDGRRLPEATPQTTLAALQAGVFEHAWPQVVRSVNVFPRRSDQRLDLIQRLRKIARVDQWRTSRCMFARRVASLAIAYW